MTQAVHYIKNTASDSNIGAKTRTYSNAYKQFNTDNRSERQLMATHTHI